MATWDDSELEEEDSEEEQAAFALMARTDKGPEGKCSSEADSHSDEEDGVHCLFSYPELKACLLETIKEHNSLLIKHNVLKKDFDAKLETFKKHEKVLSEVS